MVKIYPINSLGAEYIHSNMKNFALTVATTNELKNIDRVFDVLRKNLKKYLKEEMNFYKEAEQAFIDQMKKNVKNIPELRNKLKGRKSILKYINQEYTKEKNKSGSALNELVAAKDQIQLWQMSWYKKWYNSNKGKDLKTSQFNRYAKMVPKIIDGLISAINIIELEDNQSVFDMYAAVNFQEQIQEEKENKKEMEKSLQTILGSKEASLRLQKIAKKGINQTSMKSILLELVEIMGEVYVKIHQKFGLLAEDFMKSFINESMQFLTDGSAKVVGADHKDFQVMDVQLMEASFKKGKKIAIGFSQKFTKNMKFSTKYSNIDIFDTLASYAKAKEENDLFDKIENKKKYIMYLRRNVMALESFNLKKLDMSNILNPFIEREKELALIRGFTRFFNQYLIMAENGELNPFDKRNTKNIMGYNALIVFKQKIFWMRDFIELAYNSIDTNVMDGKWKGDVFKGRTNLKNLRSEAKKSALGALWNKKLKTLKEFEKNMEVISYKDLLAATENEISKVFRSFDVRLINSMTYTLDASKFKN